MKRLAFFLAGFFTTLLALSFLHFLGFAVILIVFGSALGMLFYMHQDTSTPFLLGLCVGLELLGVQRFGIASTVGLLTFGAYLLFAEQLRFTSLFARFIVALALVLSGSSFLLYPDLSLVKRVASVLIVLCFVGTITFFLKRAAEPTAYELL